LRDITTTYQYATYYTYFQSYTAGPPMSLTSDTLHRYGPATYARFHPCCLLDTHVRQVNCPIPNRVLLNDHCKVRESLLANRYLEPPDDVFTARTYSLQLQRPHPRPP
jgi:hypothetical protein